ncbi:MAG: hypothetical protein BME94_03420 [Methanobacteriales archaeon Met13]
MNLKKLGLIFKIMSGFVTALWIVGLLLANIYLVGLALILLIALIPVSYVHRNNMQEMFQGDDSKVIEDERTQLINEKAANMTLGIFIAVIFYIGIVIVALRGSYPQLLGVGYTLFSLAAFCLLLYVISRFYYGRKY